MTDVDKISLDGLDIVIQRDEIEVTSNLPRTDPAWVHTDSNGHEHRYGDDMLLPTLRWVVDEEGGVFVDADGYPEEYPDEGHYECVQCGERVTPGMRGPSMFREFVPGRVSYMVNDEPITHEQYQRLAERIRREML